jgi:acetyl-CoA carboxylase alpha subunit
MPRRMKARDIHQCAVSYDKIKSSQIIDALYTDFTSWEGLLDFQPIWRTPTGQTLTFEKDPAIRVGVANFQGRDVAIVAQQTPPSAQQRMAHNFGLVQADGYGLALGMMDYAEKYGLVLHSFIDTVGGDPFEASAAKLQSWLIARCQAKMLSLKTRSVSTIIGQGGSGGAIALQLAHRRLMLALSTYSVITPDGCAAILFRNVNDETINSALDILQPTADAMLKYGIIDTVVSEPLPDDPAYLPQTLEALKTALSQATLEVAEESLEDLQQELHARVAACGHVAEQKPWYRRGRRLTKRLLSFSRSPAPTTDPHIAYIRRHVLGDPDSTPQACNPVKDADGKVMQNGCGHISSLEQFRDNWQACPACHRPNPIDPHRYVDLLLDADSFHEIYADLTLEKIDGWTELYDYTASRKKSETQVGWRSP